MEELIFALFLTAGYYKMDHRLAFIQSHIDITLLLFLLSLITFNQQWLRRRGKTSLTSKAGRVSAAFGGLIMIIMGGLLAPESGSYGFYKATHFAILTGWAFFASLFFITDLQRLQKFLYSLVAITVIMSIFANYQLHSLKAATAFGSNYIALGRISGIGFLTLFLFPFSLKKKKVGKAFALLMEVLLLSALMASGARGPIVALVISLSLLYILVVLSQDVRSYFYLVILVGFIIITLITMGPSLFPNLIYRFRLLIPALAGMGGVGASTQERIALFQQALWLWSHSPIFGIGTGAFGVWLLGIDVRLYPHNIILELGSENGSIAVLLFIYLIITGFNEAIKRILSRKTLEKYLSRYFLAILIFLFASSLVSGDLNDNRMLFAFIALSTNIPLFKIKSEYRHRGGP